MIFTFNEKKKIFERTVYSFFGVLGDVGGVAQVLSIVFSFILSPISFHSYLGKAVASLFLVKTKEDGLFKSKKSA
jgi:hypothetical protein